MSNEGRDLAVRTPERDTFVDPAHEVGDAVLYGDVRPAL